MLLSRLAVGSEAPPVFNAELETLVATVADRLGVDLDAPTRSRRHGHKPRAREHVRRYLAVEVLGYRVSVIAEVESLHRSSVYASVKIGRDLVIRNAAALGLNPGDFCRRPNPYNGRDDLADDDDD